MRAAPNFYHDFVNRFDEFGTLLHCFNDHSLNWHTYCQSSKCPPLACTQELRHFPLLRYCLFYGDDDDRNDDDGDCDDNEAI